MRDTARKTTRDQEGTTPQLALAAMIDARATLHDAIVSAGMTVLGAMLEEERSKLCGPRYAHQPARSSPRRTRSRRAVLSSWCSASRRASTSARSSPRLRGSQRVARAGVQ